MVRSVFYKNWLKKINTFLKFLCNIVVNPTIFLPIQLCAKMFVL